MIFTKKQEAVNVFILFAVSLCLAGCTTLNAKNYSSMGAYYFGKGEYNSAVSYYEKAVAETPENAGNLTMLGWSYFKNVDYNNAILTFEKLAEIEPTALDAYTGRGWANFKLLKYDEAIAFFEKAIWNHPEASDPYSGIGWASSNKGDIEKAEKYLYIALEKGMKSSAKTDPEAHRALGYLNFKRGDYDTALKHLKVATTVMPAWNDARVKWGDCFFALEKYKDALIVYKHALRYEKTAQVYDKIAWSLVRLAEETDYRTYERYESALKWFGKALAVDPNYESSIAGLKEVETKIIS